MNHKFCLNVWIYIVFAFIISLFFIVKTEDKVNLDDGVLFYLAETDNSPNCLKMYYFIEKYSNEYEIPKHIAYNIAYKETRYLGPFHWSYKHAQSSVVGALGPMQIMPSTSEFINKEKVSLKQLKTDIEYNVRTSMKLLNHLYKKYKKWDIVCGVYNTGKVMVNDYALYCSETKDYKEKWITPQNQKEEHR